VVAAYWNFAQAFMLSFDVDTEPSMIDPKPGLEKAR
jgi:hypothetical protein